MNQKEIKELIEFLIDKDIAEFELERGDVKLRVKRAGAQTAPQVVTVATPIPVATAPVMSPAPSTPVASAVSNTIPDAPSQSTSTSVATDTEDESQWQMVKSPIVGTFYGSPSPGAPPFVKVGDTVSVGQVLCIVEAMKLMNEIESDHAGTVTKIYVTNGQPVEYGQKLFAVKP
jgi:acetyl-CoA carboxylase biotin carboxyl carrier protein